MPVKATKIYSGSFWKAFRPEAALKVSEWADKYRRLSSEASAEPGPWATARTPFLREIMDALSPSSPIQVVVFMKGAQIGGSEGGNNWVGFVIDEGSGSMLIVQPTLDLAKEYSKQRLQSMLDVTPRLSGKVKDVKSRDSGNATLSKKFRGGRLFIGGANSAASLCSKPIGQLFLDEIDRYPMDVQGEGDPIELVIARSRTFARRKVFKCSTPTIDGRSRIQAAFEASDKRRFHVPCLHCGHEQWLRFDKLVWPKGEPRKAQYKCDKCEQLIPEHHKTEMLAKGRWIAENPGADGGLVAGFHISSLYSPIGWFSWGEIAELFLKSKDDPTKLKSFVNTVLGDVWKEPGEAPDWKRLYDRRETYEMRKVPAAGIILTAGADVQKDRIELGIDAWGPGLESWAVDYIVIAGDTSTEAPWKELDKVLRRTIKHSASGVEIPIRLLAIDSGYNTQVVYNWARKHSPSQVMVVKGMETQSVLLGQPTAVDVSLSKASRIRRGLKLWPVGTSVAKSELYGLLRLEKPIDGEAYPAGYCHYPQYAEEFFKQLTAETIRVTKVRGFRKTAWEKTRERNEALDIRIYSRAAAAALGLDRLTPEDWVELAGEVGATIAVPSASDSDDPSSLP